MKVGFLKVMSELCLNCVHSYCIVKLLSLFPSGNESVMSRFNFSPVYVTGSCCTEKRGSAHLLKLDVHLSAVTLVHVTVIYMDHVIVMKLTEREPH
jgi:hypothetical protein